MPLHGGYGPWAAAEPRAGSRPALRVNQVLESPFLEPGVTARSRPADSFLCRNTHHVVLPHNQLCLSLGLGTVLTQQGPPTSGDSTGDE